MARKRGGKNNGIKHGAYAEELILPDENVDEFLQLYQRLTEEWQPVGISEEETVLDLAKCLWQKRRVERFYYREATGGQFQDKDQIKYVIYLVELLQKSNTLEDATVFTSHLPEAYRQWIAQEVPRSKFQNDESWRIWDLVGAHAKFARATLSTYKSNHSTYLRELTAKKITLDERLDARIDKAIKRLAQLKTFKQIVREQDSRAKIDQHSIPDHRPQTSAN
jgi:hypothetical protein